MTASICLICAYSTIISIYLFNGTCKVGLLFAGGERYGAVLNNTSFTVKCITADFWNNIDRNVNICQQVE